MKSLFSKSHTAIFIILICEVFLLCACGPSKDKIAEAQQTYRTLIKTHNEVVSAHSAINDNSLDEELTALSKNIVEIETYNLNEMNNAEIDVLIDTMNSIIDSYNGFLQTIGVIKEAEDAAYLSTIYISIKNSTTFPIDYLYLMEKGDTTEITNALDSLGSLKVNQQMFGLAIYKDVSETPWILKIGTNETDDEGNILTIEHELELDVSAFNEKQAITITQDPETGEISYCLE